MEDARVTAVDQVESTGRTILEVGGSEGPVGFLTVLSVQVWGFRAVIALGVFPVTAADARRKGARFFTL